MRIELSVGSQAISFLLFCLTGVIAGVIFDAYRAFMKINYKNNSYAAGDILIAFIISAFIFVSFLKISEFRINYYSIIGIILGTSLYFLCFSRQSIRILIVFLNFFEKILKILLSPVKFLCIIIFRMVLYPYKLLNKPFKRILRFINDLAESFKKCILRFKKI